MSLWLNGIFKDNMVFQRDKEIHVFGETDFDPDNKITAKITGANGKILSKGTCEEIYEDGFFLVILPQLPKGGPYKLTVRSSKTLETCTVKDIYIGEVWVAGGQSNMEYPLIRTEFANTDVPNCPDTRIHFYKIPVFGEYSAEQRIAEEDSQWSVINRDTCGEMSGVAFYFAMKIEEYLANNADEDLSDLHFGVIGCYLGGTSVSSWQSIESLEKTKEGTRIIDEFEAEVAFKSDEQFQKELEEYQNACNEYQERLDQLMIDDPYISYHDAEKELGSFPWPPPVGRTSIRRPGALFETMVLRIVPYSIRGVIFYQGEEDTDEHSDDYHIVFRTLIEEWREAFWDDDLPFLFCQLPMYISKDRKYMGYDDMKWPKLRKQQHHVEKTMNNVYMAVLADCGEFDNVHPSDKKTPGERLAMLALRFVYGFSQIPAVSPYVIDIRNGEGVEISFNGDFNHLNLLTQFASDESGFEIADPDGVFHKAEAAVDFDGRTVIINSRDVEIPTKVRYAFFSYGVANLVSDTGLAAAPFEIGLDKSIAEYY